MEDEDKFNITRAVETDGGEVSGITLAELIAIPDTLYQPLA